MRMICISILLLITLACSQEKKNAQPLENQAPNIQESVSIQAVTPVQTEEEPDRTKELYLEIKDLFSGSWKYSHATHIDGERDVSWGTVPFSNQSYFIIDFQNANRIIIRGATEGGSKGFDRYVGDVYKIEEEDGLYHFFYKNTISTRNPNRKHKIILRYNTENDTMAIIGYGDNIYENPSEMIRISEPLHEQ